ncbi:MAG: hypothetical protein L0229_03970 [Blastocatellia bacterium]|nr:hypothetical protein [Blastocatellia bacterium]
MNIGYGYAITRPRDYATTRLRDHAITRSRSGMMNDEQGTLHSSFIVRD